MTTSDNRDPSLSPLERMPFSTSPTDKRAPAHQVGVSYDHLAFNRAVLFWLHLVLGVAAALVYISTIDTTHLRWWRRGAGLILLIRSSGPLVPYVVSGVFSRRVATANRFGIWLFALVLVLGTAAIAYFYLTRTVQVGSAFLMLEILFVQGGLYCLAARALFGTGPTNG